MSISGGKSGLSQNSQGDEGVMEKGLSMTTVFRDDLLRIQILRRKCGDGNSQECVSRALTALETSLAVAERSGT